MSTTAYSWLRELPKETLAMSDAAPFGHPPAFDIGKFAQDLAETLQLKGLSFSLAAPDIRMPDKFLEGFANPIPLFFKVQPFDGSAVILISQQDLKKLLDSFIHKDSEVFVIDEDFKKAFFNFVVAESIISFQRTFPDKGITISYLQEGSLPEEESYTFDITLQLPHDSLTARLILPESMRHGWREKFAKKDFNVPAPLIDKLNLTIHLEAGKLSLPMSAWKSVQLGDFLILDSCTLIPGEDKGRVILTVGSTPFFRGKIKDGNLKILEYPFFQEVNTMAKLPPNDEIEDDFSDDLTEDFADEDTDDLAADESVEEEAEPEASLQDSERPVKADDIPLNIVVEVGRFQMTIQKLLELKAGQTLNLDINPEDGVDLVAGGVCIAKGELLKLGDTLGVRITDIAH